jgi:lactose/L-arabinose transport system permease protein
MAKEQKQVMLRSKNKNKRFFSAGNMFILLPVVMISVLVFVPMIMAFFTSFKGGTPAQMTWNGLANYQRLLSDTTFKKAFFNTFIYLLIQVPVMLILALIVSFLLNDAKLKFKGLFRTAMFLPCITSLVSYSLIMKSLFSGNGLINRLLQNIHVIDVFNSIDANNFYSAIFRFK